jgi:translation initiation factor 2 beta subunit (eIF-2beta)/eIF-5
MHVIKKILSVLNHVKFGFYPLMILLVYLGFRYETAENHTDDFWQWIDPVAGIMTFATTLVIFGIQAYNNWEDSLEKQLSVDYIYTGGLEELTIVQVKNAYLAGDGDVRAWAQALGGQMMGNLDFDMNWDEEPQKIHYDNKEGKYFKYYAVKLYLTTDPRTIKNDDRKGEKVMLSFLERKFKHSKLEGDLENLPINWIRN